jgi:hypothetical protein
MKKIHVIELKLLSWSVAALWSGGSAVELWDGAVWCDAG